MKLDKKKKIGVIAGILTYIIVQIILKLIKINNLTDEIVIGVLLIGGILFTFSINVEKSRMNLKSRIIGSILMMLMCILCSLVILIAHCPDKIFECYKKPFLVILISAPISFFALTIFFGILYFQMTKRD